MTNTNRAQVETIVTQSAARAALNPTQRDALTGWMHRWMTAFTTEREYDTRAITTMSRNAAASIKFAK